MLAAKPDSLCGLPCHGHDELPLGSVAEVSGRLAGVLPFGGL